LVSSPCGAFPCGTSPYGVPPWCHPPVVPLPLWCFGELPPERGDTGRETPERGDTGRDTPQRHHRGGHHKETPQGKTPQGGGTTGRGTTVDEGLGSHSSFLACGVSGVWRLWALSLCGVSVLYFKIRFCISSRQQESRSLFHWFWGLEFGRKFQGEEPEGSPEGPGGGT